MKSYYSIVCAFLCAWMAVIPAFGQKIEVKGRITDASGVPLVGASIINVAEQTGRVSDADGAFAIEATPQTELQFSYLGYVSQTVVVGSRTFLEIVLQEQGNMMDDVVVIGYGTVQKKDLTGAIQSIGGEELVDAMNTNVSESLNGRVSGVLVNKSSNRPGADMSIQIRGVNSFNFSNEPLYVIDGVPSQSGMRHLNASDIESIDILKDASSCAIYGSRGANGVVIVTTKGGGKKSGFSLDYTGSVGVKTPTRIPDMIGNMGHGMEYVDYRIQLWRKKYGDASLSRSDFLTDAEKERIRYGEYYDWLREFSSPAVVTNHSLIGSGGTEKTSYTIGLGYTLDNGMVGKESFERFTANIGLEHRISEKVKMSLSSYLSQNDTDQGSNDALLNAYLLPPIVSPYDTDGSYLFNCQPTSSKINPFVQAENNIRKREEFYANVTASLEVEPVEGLSLKSQFAAQHNSDQSGEWVGTMTQQNSGVNPPSASRSEGRNLNFVWDNIVTFDRQFGKDHKLNVIGLFSLQKETHKGSSMSGNGLPYESWWHAIQTADEILNVSSYYWEASMVSAMMRMNYTLKDRYMITLTGRYDGTSRLATGNQWGFMPSVAVGWQLKNERFLESAEWINALKLRLSWGKSGNNNIDHDITWTKLNLTRYVFGGTGVNGFEPAASRGNKELRWEMTSEWNVSVDFAFLNNRISGTVDLYDRRTDDLIFARSVGSINGYSSILQNIGKTQNRGIEVGLNTVNVAHKNFTWRTGITFSLNRNKILDLYGDKQDDLANRWFIGHPISVQYNLKQLGIWQEEEAEEASKYSASPGHIKVLDKDHNYSIDEQDFVILGTPSPDWTAGMNNTFVYKNFDLSVYMYAEIGGLYSDDFTYMFSAWDNEHWNKLDLPYWTPENRNNKYPAVGAQSYNTQVLGLVSGTFLKIQNITLGYTLPERIARKLRMQSARAYVSVQNPFTFTAYRGSDPEVIGENVYTQLSLYPMTFTFGLNLKF